MVKVLQRRSLRFGVLPALVGGIAAALLLIFGSSSGASSVTPGTVATVSNVAGADTTYTVTFNTSLTGAMPGVSKTCPTACSITLTAPNGTNFPSALSNYSVTATIGGATVSLATLTKVIGPGGSGTSATNNQVVLTLSASSITASDPVTVTITNTNNPIVASTTNVIDESTAADITPTPTSDYTIVHASASQLVVASGNNQSAGVGQPFAAPLVVNAEDPYGNPVGAGIPVTFTAPPSGASATFTAPGTGNTDGPVATTGGSTATSTVPTANGTASGGYSVIASSPGLSSATFTLANVGTPAKLVITSSPGSAAASATTNLGPITVQEQDSFGNPTFAAETVQMSSNSAGTAGFAPILGGGFGTGMFNIPAGSSSISIYYGDTKAGTPTITATATGLTTATQNETITAGAPANLFFTSAAVSGAASSSATLGPITVQEQDAFGNSTTSAETVNLSSSTTGIAVFSATSGGTAVTSVVIPAGSSSATFFYGDTKVGTPTITAAATGLNSAMQPEAITAAVPAKLVFTTLPLSATAASVANLGPVTIQEEDTFGNPTTAAESVQMSSSSTGTAGFAPILNGGFGSGSFNIAATNSSISIYYGDTKAGTPTITAAATGLVSATQQETITPSGTAKVVVVSGNNQSTAPDTAFASPLVAQIEDQFGNPVDTAGVQITFTAPSSGPSAVFSNSTNVEVDNTNASGIATTSILTANGTAGPSYSVVASGSGLTATNFTLTNRGGVAKLVFTSAPVSGAASSSATLGPITVQEQDAFGNPTTTAETVNLSSNSTGPHGFATTSGGTAVTSVTIPAGSSSASFFYGDTTAGTPTLTAAATGLTSGTQVETITGGPPTILVISTAPLSGTAANSATLGPIQVEEEDAFRNLSTTALTVHLSSNSSGGTFAATSGGTAITSINIPAGSSFVDFYYGDTKAGTPTITASATGLISATQMETITTGPPAKLAFTSAAVSGAASSSDTLGPITVQEQDAVGNPTTTAVTVNLTSTSGTGTFAATSGGTAITSINIPAGSSSATFFYGDPTAGTPTLTAAATGLTSATQVETITPGTPTKLVFTTAPFNGGVSLFAPIRGPITVQEQDALGNPTTTAETVNLSSNSTGSFTFAATSGGTPVTSVAIPAGSSTATFFYGDSKAGTPTLTAAATGLTSATQVETLRAGPPARLIFTSAAVSGAASSSDTLGPITVQEQDQFGNPTTIAETVNLSSTAGTGTFAATSGGTATTSINIPVGSSSASFFYGDTSAGTPTITAAATGLTSATQGETITAGTPAKLVFSTAAVSGTASSSATLAPITVQEQDALGNPTTTAETVNVSSSSSGAKFAATSGGTAVTSVAIPAGSSSVSFFYGDTKAGTPTITAAATGLTSATQGETITAGTPAKLVFTTLAVSGAASSSPTLGPITVQEQDALGNPTITAETVKLSSTAGTGTFAATSGGGGVTSVAIPAGSSSISFFYGDTKSGTPTLTAAATGLTSATQTETITGGAPAKLAFTTPTQTGLATIAATLGPITVQEQDALGNPATSAETVNLSSNSSGPHAFAATSGGAAVTSVTIPAGSSSASFFYGDTKAGTPTITAAATGLTSATQTETILPGTAAQLVITSAPQTGVASSSADLGPMTVQEEDVLGNPTTQAETVNLSSSSATGLFSATVGGTTVSSVSIPSGSSTANFAYGDTNVGGPTITAAASGLITTHQTETVTAGGPARLAFTSAPITIGATSARSIGPIIVQEQDSLGNPTTAGATVNLSTTSGTGTFAATSGGAAVTSVTIPAGSSSVTLYYGDSTPGSPILTASATGLSSGAQVETITAGPAAKLVFTTEPANSAANAPLTTQPVVTIEDALGNTVASGPSSTDAVKLSLSTNVFSTGSSTATVNAVNGVATFSGLEVNGAATYTLVATDVTEPAVTSATSTPFTITSSSPNPPPPGAQHGYYMVGSDGGIFTFGSSNFFGSTGSLKLQRPVVALAPTSDRNGYWLVASDGGIFAFGDAFYHGSIPGLGLHPAGSGLPNSLNAPIVGMVPSSDGGGYFMVGADGGVFAFGDAKFSGSCPGIGGCTGAAVAVMPDNTGNGYWVVTKTGNVYNFGDAVNFGQPGAQVSPVTAAVATPDGKGYLILLGDGQVLPFGDAPHDGSPSGANFVSLNPANAIFTTSDGQGYWVASAQGKVFTFGDAPFDGDMSSIKLNGAIINANGY